MHSRRFEWFRHSPFCPNPAFAPFSVASKTQVSSKLRETICRENFIEKICLPIKKNKKNLYKKGKLSRIFSGWQFISFERLFDSKGSPESLERIFDSTYQSLFQVKRYNIIPNQLYERVGNFNVRDLPLIKLRRSYNFSSAFNPLLFSQIWRKKVPFGAWTITGRTLVLSKAKVSCFKLSTWRVKRKASNFSNRFLSRFSCQTLKVLFPGTETRFSTFSNKSSLAP